MDTVFPKWPRTSRSGGYFLRPGGRAVRRKQALIAPRAINPFTYALEQQLAVVDLKIQRI